MKKIKVASIISLLGLFIAEKALAVCPVCVFGVGAGVGLTRYLKIDDTITGLWIGGLIVGLIIWTIDFFKKRNINFKGIEILITLIYYSFIFGPLYYYDLLGHSLNKIWGIDKLIFSITLGSVCFLAFEKHFRITRARRGKSLFRYQKVVWAILPLIILSIIFYFITK